MSDFLGEGKGWDRTNSTTYYVRYRTYVSNSNGFLHNTKIKKHMLTSSFHANLSHALSNSCGESVHGSNKHRVASQGHRCSPMHTANRIFSSAAPVIIVPLGAYTTECAFEFLRGIHSRTSCNLIHKRSSANVTTAFSM